MPCTVYPHRLESNVPKRREFLLGSVAGLATVAASRSALAQASSPSLRTYLADEMRKARIPGMQVAVVRQERILFLEHFGLADIENAVPVTGATVFQIASLTKAFVGVAVMQLVESGKLDLGDPVSPPSGGAASGVAGGHGRPARRSHVRPAGHRGGYQQPEACSGRRRGGVMGEGPNHAHGVRARRPIRVQPDELCPARQDHRSISRRAVRAVPPPAPVRGRWHDAYGVWRRPRRRSSQRQDLHALPGR